MSRCSSHPGFPTAGENEIHIQFSFLFSSSEATKSDFGLPVCFSSLENRSKIKLQILLKRLFQMPSLVLLYVFRLHIRIELVRPLQQN